jgi:hypothetical protein
MLDARLVLERLLKPTYQTQEKSPCGMYLSRDIDALAADVHSAAEEKMRGFSGLAFSPWIAKSDSRLLQ